MLRGLLLLAILQALTADALPDRGSQGDAALDENLLEEMVKTNVRFLQRYIRRVQELLQNMAASDSPLAESILSALAEVDESIKAVLNGEDVDAGDEGSEEGESEVEEGEGEVEADDATEAQTEASAIETRTWTDTAEEMRRIVKAMTNIRP